MLGSGVKLAEVFHSDCDTLLIKVVSHVASFVRWNRAEPAYDISRIR
jgi:hypothetical protein